MPSPTSPAIHLVESKKYSNYLCNSKMTVAEYNPKQATLKVSKVTCQNCLKIIEKDELYFDD